MLLRSLKNARVPVPNSRQGAFAGSARSFTTPLNSPVLPGKPPLAPKPNDQYEQSMKQAQQQDNQQNFQSSLSPAESAASILDRLNEDKHRKNTHEMAPENPDAPVDHDNQIREMLLSCLVDVVKLRKTNHVTASTAYPNQSNSLPSLNELYSQLNSHAGVQLPYSLPYEPTPDEHRKVKFSKNDSSLKPEWTKVLQAARNPSAPSAMDHDKDDGIVLVAHVFNDGGNQKISYSMGFGLEGGEGAVGNELVLSCAHTLQAIHTYTESSQSSNSCTLILTRSGQLYPASRIASSLPENDLVLYELGEQLYRPRATNENSPKVRTLPVNPYPARENEKQVAHIYANTPGQSNWVNTDILGYLDGKGCEAQPGTYDDLASVSLSIIPTPGSSAGPVVNVETGSVSGVLRGSRFRHGDRKTIGFATPAEKIFEMFKLPGFTTTLERERERQQKAK